MAKPIFITGATGMIGGRLAQVLAAQGETVHALVRDSNRARAIMHPNIRLFKGELTDIDSIQTAIKGCDRVYHLAAYAKAWARDATIFDRINYEAVLDLMDIAERNGVEKVVLTSTAGVLGHRKGLHPVNEEANGQMHLMTRYEQSKAKLEKAVQEKAAAGYPVVIVNPTRVYGTESLNDSNGLVVIMDSYLKGKFRFLPGDGSSMGSYAFLDDVVNGHIAAMEKGRTGHRYILGGENASFSSFFETWARVAGKKYKMFPTPVSLLMAFAHVQQFAADHFGRYPLITPELVRKYTLHWDFSSEKAKNELGYTFRPLAEGMERILSWLTKARQG